MESNGRPGCIHVSQVTADILIGMGKKHWVEARDEKVHCKGKGDMQTYFVSVNGADKSVVSSASPTSDASSRDEEDMFDVEVAVAELEGVQDETEDDRLDWVEKNYRRIGWVRDLLQEELEKVASQRGKAKGDPKIWKSKSSVSTTRFSWNGDMAKALLSSSDRSPKPISDDLSREILEFVSQVAYSHARVPYHNFDQTCCVIMSLDRMLKHVWTAFGSELKPSPLAKLACLFSALILNLSPPLAPNVDRRQGEGFVLAHQSAAELRSADAALELLRGERFRGLREALCANALEFQSFWGMVQNLILATDASGSILSEERDARWDLSFGSNADESAPHAKVISILEHVLLVAEEGYAAQHWENYLKWSTLLLSEYREMHKKGQLHEDPDRFWDRSRLDYFDSFVLPLAQKISDAGVLGSIGGEFYTYASQNRRELESAEGIKSMKESSHDSMNAVPVRIRRDSSKNRRWSVSVPNQVNKTKAAEMRKSAQGRKVATVPEVDEGRMGQKAVTVQEAADVPRIQASQRIVFERKLSNELEYENIVEV
jgi:hypothetical protein